MAKILYIEASPRKDRSASIEVARHFLNSYREHHPGDPVETLDLWQASLPRFDAAVLDAKYAIMNSQPHTQDQARAWQAVVNLASHFKAADKYVLSVPMWNFGIPYVLKHYIDVLVQPGLTFSFSPAEGYKGLVQGKPAVVVYARGGAYAPGTGAESYDLQSPYVNQILGFMGFTTIHSVFVEPTVAAPEQRAKGLAAAKQRASELAASF